MRQKATLWSANEHTTLIPRQRTTSLVLGDACLKEILFFFQVNHFSHPGERVTRAGIQHINTNLLTAAVCDKAQVFLEHACIQAQHTTWHSVFCVSIFQLDSLLHQTANFLTKL